MIYFLISVPDNGPIFDGAVLTSQDTAVVSWIELDFTNKTHLDFLNSYEYESFKVTMQSLPLDYTAEAPTPTTEPYESTNFTFTSDHFEVYRIGVAITNSHGSGPEREICVALGEHSEYLSLFIKHFHLRVIVKYV